MARGMQHDLTDTEAMIRDAARRIARERIAPLADRLDRGEGREDFLANLTLLAENGFMGLNVAAEHGGTEAGPLAFALAIEELAYACASTAVTTSVTNMVAEVIQAVGSADQKASYLPRLCDGTYPAGAFCLTEAGAGSDPSGMAMRARRDGNHFVLDGEKLYITSGAYAGIFVVWAVTNPDAPKGRGITCFLVEAGTPGLVIGKAEAKTGQTGSATNVVTFDGCRVPASAVMGEVDGGFRIAVAELAGGRIGIAALALGLARAAMDAAKAYAQERKQFGKALAAFQGLQWMIADREVDLAAARLLIHEAARLKAAGQPFAKAASMAKLFASEAAARCTDTAVQLFGGAGYVKDYPVERYARDARITRIYEGTSEVQRMIIARETLKA
jgi:alkylation response protein AidB-like acyl-CoA dehydrogenase